MSMLRVAVFCKKCKEYVEVDESEDGSICCTTCGGGSFNMASADGFAMPESTRSAERRDISDAAAYVLTVSTGWSAAFTCPVCGLGYALRESYFKHILRKHPEDES